MKILTPFFALVLVILYIVSCSSNQVSGHKELLLKHYHKKKNGNPHNTKLHPVKKQVLNDAKTKLEKKSAPTPFVGPCDVITPSSPPFCNMSLPLDERVADLVSRIPASDIPGLMINSASGSSAINFGAYEWWSEALHGVALSPGVHFEDPTPYATSFPQVTTTGASFNKELWSQIGDTIGKEGRAMNNVGTAGLTFWAPNINVGRDQRWGRVQEVAGSSEEPMIQSMYAYHFIRGMQNNSMDPTRLRVSACAKHFFGYDLEDWGGISRHQFNAIIDEDDLYDFYLPQFETAYHPNGGAASGAMCSYNAETVPSAGVFNTPSCADATFINGKMRGDWQFDGYVTSDCGAIDDIYANHKFVNTPEQALGVAMRAGTDLDCGYIYKTSLEKALSNGDVSNSTVQNALKNQFRVLFRLGVFDPVDSQPYKKLGPKDVNTPEAQQLAYQAAAEGIVLLQYDSNRFPLSTTIVKRIAVMGGNANAPLTQLGNYYGVPQRIITPVQGLEKYAEVVEYFEGCPVDRFDATQLTEACNIAQGGVDAVVLVVGNNQEIESEGHDRDSMAIPNAQNLFVKKVAFCSPVPVVVVAMTGSSIDYSDIINPKNTNNGNIIGLLNAGYPGEMGGQAIADIIFGAVSPSGRLAHAVYPSNFVNEVGMYDMGFRSNASQGYPGRTYRYYTGDVVFPFGHGLTFTTFDVKLVSACPSGVTLPTASELKQNPSTLISICQFQFNVTNTGVTFSGKYSLLLHMMEVNAPTQRGYVNAPLTDFGKTKLLAPGETDTITLNAKLFSVMRKNAVVAGDYSWCTGGEDGNNNNKNKNNNKICGTIRVPSS